MIEYAESFFDLYYHDSNTRIMLGDHILYSKWFGLKKIESRVCYVPGVSPPNKNMADSKSSSMWAIENGSNDIVQMLYVVDDKFVSRRIKFVKRAADKYKGLLANESLA